MPKTKRMVQLARITTRKYMLEVALAIFGSALAANIAFPIAANADIDVEARLPKQELVAAMIDEMTNHLEPYGILPEAKLGKPLWTIQVPISAYNSEVGQTDDTPFITASGTHVHDGTIAANFLPIGTQVRIPSLFGDKVFVVEDRMNPRYYYKMDIWMKYKADAKQFGVKYAEVEIYDRVEVDGW